MNLTLRDFALCIFAASSTLTACSPPAPQPMGDASSADTSAAADAEGGVSADGGGVCCTPTIRTGCSPGFGLRGGWAPTVAQCQTGGGFDGCPFESSLDEHGCTVITSPFNCTNRCNPGPPDASTGPRDAGTDATATSDASDASPG